MLDMEFADRYITKDFLGDSPAGKYFAGEDKKFNRKVLIKILDNANEDTNKDIEKRFDNLTKLSGQLIHPNILTTIDYFKTDDKLVSVHEYIDPNRTMLDLKKISLLSMQEKIKIAITLADALDFCHKIGFFHNNILMDSLYLNDNINIKIDHCGLKRVVKNETLYSELGIESKTPLFYPPEYFKKSYNHYSVDIFQYGCFLYTLFVEIYPFGEEISEENIRKLKNLEYFDPSCFADVNKNIISIIKTCLNRNPEERFRNFTDILFELKDAEDEKKIKAAGYSFKIKDNKTFMVVPKGYKADIEEIEKKLISQNIYNYDINKIKYAILYSNGKEIEIGENFKKIDPTLFEQTEIEINKDATKAFFVKKKTLQLTPEEITFILKKNGIKHGIVPENIQKIIDSEPEQSILIAEATPPEDGLDSYFVYFFEKDNVLKPTIENDIADFKNISVFQEVKKNEILCLKIPFTLGKDGKDVFGRPIKAKPGKDFKMPAGKNTYISSDGCKLMSTIDGLIDYQNSKINVKEVIIIHGDVDYSTGNIKYHGDVIIKGDILPDFSVKAGGDIKIFGVVEGGYIESEKGSISVKSGIFGKEKSEVIAFKDIGAEFIQDCKVVAGQDVSVKDYVRNSSVTCGRSFICTKGIGQVDGCTITAKRFILINIAGTKPYVKTSLIINRLDKFKLKAERTELLEKLKTVENSIIAVKNNLKNLIIKHGDIEDLLMNSEYKLLSEKLKLLEDLSGSINEKLRINEDNITYVSSSTNEFIAIKKAIYPDVILRIGNLSFKNEEEIFSNIKAEVEEGQIKLKVK
ncbi:MAG: hypothetical protein JG762_597 [Deferribacteraceae bacterium]|jgi:hypothetical protein|nr:hypothetical protein [Deferribacteraceae bacterium]